MKRLLLALALLCSASAHAQTLADSLLARAYQGVMTGPAFSFGFELRIGTPDALEVIPGTALTRVVPPEGVPTFRVSFQDAEAVTIAYDGEVFEYSSPRTQKVYADSSGAQAEGLRQGYITYLALFPAFGTYLHTELAGAGETAVIEKGTEAGRSCTQVTYPSIPADAGEEELPEIRVCYDERTGLPLHVGEYYPSTGIRYDLRLTSLKRVPVPRAGSFSLGTPEGWRRTNYSGGDGNPLQVGDVAPDFALQTESGETVRLGDLRGQTVVLDFWGTWCAPCVEALPAMGELAEDHPEVTVLGLASYETEDAEPEAFARARGVEYPVLLADTATLEAYRIYAFPTYVVVSPDGTVLFHAVHDTEAGGTEAALEAFLGGL